MSDTFNHNGMSRREIAEIYANLLGERYDFTDKDFEWVEYCEDMMKQTDEYLHEWAYSEGL